MRGSYFPTKTFKRSASCTQICETYEQADPITLLCRIYRACAVGVATVWDLDGGRVRVYLLYLLHVVQTGSGGHPAPYVMGHRGSFPGLKLSVCKIAHPEARVRFQALPEKM
jgi:hypothetical protein